MNTNYFKVYQNGSSTNHYQCHCHYDNCDHIFCNNCQRYAKSSQKHHGTTVNGNGYLVLLKNYLSNMKSYVSLRWYLSVITNYSPGAKLRAASGQRATLCVYTLLSFYLNIMWGTFPRQTTISIHHHQFCFIKICMIVIKIHIIYPRRTSGRLSFIMASFAPVSLSFELTEAHAYICLLG